MTIISLVDARKQREDAQREKRAEAQPVPVACALRFDIRSAHISPQEILNTLEPHVYLPGWPEHPNLSTVFTLDYGCAVATVIVGPQQMRRRQFAEVETLIVQQLRNYLRSKGFFTPAG